MKPCLCLIAAGALCLPIVAHAHVSIVSGPATAGATNLITFGVGHGCAGADTYRLTVEIPAGVTGVRPMGGDLGRPMVAKDAEGNVTSVTWQKPDDEVFEADVAYYQVVLRLKAPEAPFTPLYFVAHQTCRAADGTESTVDWSTLPGDEGAGEEDHPAAPVMLLPARVAGWNRFTVSAAMTELAMYFSDAQIVWKDGAAFSANPVVTDQIGATPGVSALESLEAGDEIWVKY
ncbi:MAG: DUF1775 domain-containing protein [Myxococcales bacterium]|nr:DUF1775 domain-containing protein [Myxococcales bacterium]